MKIVWINKRNWLQSGPIVNMTVHNAHSFASIGLESHLCLGAGDSPSPVPEDLQHFYGLEPLPHFHVHRIQRASGALAGASFSIYQAGARLVRQLARHDDVAVFTREPGLLPLLTLMSRHPRVRGFYELHDFHADLSWRDERPRLKERQQQWIERFFLPRISGLVCITREMEKRYTALFPRQAIISRPLGTKQMPAADIEARRRARTLFYIGHLHRYKGLPLLEKAAIQLARHGVRTEFWGSYEKSAARIRLAAQQQGVDSWVEAVPFQPPACVQQALAERASLGAVMLADTYYNRYLTCPVKALDYLSHGIPALGTDIPSVREVLADSGLYLSDESPEPFVATVLRLLDDPAAYASAVHRARSRAAEITWQQRALALADFARSTWRRQAASIHGPQPPPPATTGERVEFQ